MSVKLSVKQMSTIDRYKTIHLLYNKVGNDAFWAKDVVGIANPATLTALRKIGILKNTGVTKEHFVPIDIFDDTYKKVIVQQWQFCDNFKQTLGYHKLMIELDVIRNHFNEIAKSALVIVETITDDIAMYDSL